MDFGRLPPEINSVRMYSGPGADSMRAAAAAWAALAQELREAATNSRSITSGAWAAVGTLSTTAAAHIDWFAYTAAQCQQTAEQASAAAAAYETAFAAMVPPQTIGANRILRRRLAAVNWFGQYTALMAAIEGDYEEMWALDAAAMYAYADGSAAASAIPGFSRPPTATGVAGNNVAHTKVVDQKVIATAAQIVSRLPHVVKSLSSARSERYNVGLLAVTPSLARMSLLRLGFAKESSVPIAVAITAAAKAIYRRRAEATGALGRKASIGPLAVPRSWIPAAGRSAVAQEYPSTAKRLGGKWISRSRNR